MNGFTLLFADDKFLRLPVSRDDQVRDLYGKALPVRQIVSSKQISMCNLVTKGLESFPLLPKPLVGKRLFEEFLIVGLKVLL